MIGRSAKMSFTSPAPMTPRRYRVKSGIKRIANLVKTSDQIVSEASAAVVSVIIKISILKVLGMILLYTSMHERSTNRLINMN